MNTQEMAAKLREIKEYQRMIEEATAEMESLKDEVKAVMTAENTDCLVVDTFKVSWKSVITNRLDTTALKKDLPELAQKYTKTSESKRFTIA